MRANFSDPGLERFVTDHLAELAPTAPEQSRHALSFDGLRAPGVRLWAARQASEIVGMAALAALESGHAEYCAPARALYRGAGFVECGPFGSYWADPHGVFMTRTG